MVSDTATRHILVVSHTGRAATLDATVTVCEGLLTGGVTPVLHPDDRTAVLKHGPGLQVAILGDGVGLPDIELVIVVGGDGTILRAAELVRESRSNCVATPGPGHQGRQRPYVDAH